MEDAISANALHANYGPAKQNSPPLNMQSGDDGCYKFNHDHDLLTKSATAPLSDLDTQVVKLQHSLQSWREIIICIYSLLLWEKHWHVGAIVGGMGGCFLFLYVINPPTLTILSAIGLIITLCDFFVPILASTFIRAEWTTKKERQFNEICKKIIVIKAKIEIAWSSYFLKRYTKPTTFYSITTGVLLILCWLGHQINSFLLTYLLVTMLLLTPGLEQKGILRGCVKRLNETFSSGRNCLETLKAKKN